MWSLEPEELTRSKKVVLVLGHERVRLRVDDAAILY